MEEQDEEGHVEDVYNEDDMVYSNEYPDTFVIEKII